MPNWLLIVALIVGVLAAGMLRERWRLRGMEGLARRRGWVMHSPFAPGEQPPMARLAERLEGRAARRWGGGLTGTVDGLEMAIAEHETAPSGIDATGSPNTTGIWRVMVAWRVRPDEATTIPDAPWPHGGEIVRDGEWAAWRVRGNLTEATAEWLLSHLSEARRHAALRQHQQGV